MRCIITLDPNSNTPTSVMWLKDRVIHANVLGVLISLYVTDIILFSRRGVLCVTKLRDVTLDNDGDILPLFIPNLNSHLDCDGDWGVPKYPVLFPNRTVHDNLIIQPQSDEEFIYGVFNTTYTKLN